jgi:hypothetical protein
MRTKKNDIKEQVTVWALVTTAIATFACLVAFPASLVTNTPTRVNIMLFLSKHRISTQKIFFKIMICHDDPTARGWPH